MTAFTAPIVHPVPRRLFIFGLALASTAAATAVWADLLAQNGVTVFDIIQVILFALNFGWVSVFFWSSIVGWLRILLKGRTPGLVYPAPLSQGEAAPELKEGKPVAILIPVYNESPEAVFGRVGAMYRSLEQIGNLAPFHFFILSDTTEADIWVAEEIAWMEAIRQLGAQGRIFYRRRAKNTARKAGNIADFCTRWGAQYEHMIVLDADSLLTGETLLQLARFGRLNPDAGIIQGLPSIIGASSLFARTQQFAARLYGPILAAGINFWHLGDGNYWGHNAIIKTAFFTAYCGLPSLPGKPPFGGHILSHDFVEAALIRRGGAKVWLVAEIEGCFEQMPASIIENGKRERRWTQGNLQHSKLLLAAGLHPLSRTHLFMGITSYLAPVLGLLFLFTGLASATYANLVPPDYFPEGRTLFPNWPVFDGDRALSLLAIVFFVLTLPKLLACFAAVVQNPQRWGGRLRLVFSVLVEHIFTILIAPINMLIQSGFVIDVLLGRDSGWGAQNRGDADTTWREAFRRHRFHTFFGIALSVYSWYLAPTLFWWLLPIAVGLVLAMPISVFSSRTKLGQRLQRWGLFLIPEEVQPPAVWLQAAAIEEEIRKLIPAVDGPFGRVAEVCDNPQLNALHLSLLADDSHKTPDQDVLATARRKLAVRVEGGTPPALSNAERVALLLDNESLAQAPLGLRPQLP